MDVFCFLFDNDLRLCVCGVCVLCVCVCVCVCVCDRFLQLTEISLSSLIMQGRFTEIVINSTSTYAFFAERVRCTSSHYFNCML